MIQLEKGEKKGDVFDRISKGKKRTAGEREDVTYPEGNKRFKKGKLEEVKIDKSGSTIIDLSQHKNNIRARPGEEPAQDEKKRVKCKHWPNCNNTDEECPYIHPKEECPYFPKCQFGEKCIYIHPDVPSFYLFK